VTSVVIVKFTLKPGITILPRFERFKFKKHQKKIAAPYLVNSILPLFRLPQTAERKESTDMHQIYSHIRSHECLRQGQAQSVADRVWDSI
jgi:hypothetical protein